MGGPVACSLVSRCELGRHLGPGGPGHPAAGFRRRGCDWRRRVGGRRGERKPSPDTGRRGGGGGGGEPGGGLQPSRPHGPGGGPGADGVRRLRRARVRPLLPAGGGRRVARRLPALQPLPLRAAGAAVAVLEGREHLLPAGLLQVSLGARPPLLRPSGL
ncbi:hypothetical protein EYF80_062733 [Liparis tanakae]|uniref:Uncharacterized protein n=1 Tax=Liparis tanakae TaxID=230148 RepID=A0A4Z2EF59_9TELE|nr:hypothetical protein EYF80_062733 [Liparis tanakae]